MLRKVSLRSNFLRRRTGYDFSAAASCGCVPVVVDYGMSMPQL